MTRQDAAMAGGVAAVLALVVSAGQAGTPDTGAYVWAVALGALMLWRRRYPRGVLALTVLGMFAYYAAGYPAIGVALPVAAALFSAAEAGHRRAAILAGAVVLAVSAAFRLLDGQDFRYVVLYEATGHLALMAAAVALGELVRARRRIDALMSRQVAMAAERRIDEHRQALSRELHDSIGHTLTVAAIHTNVARQEAARDPAATRAALDQVAGAVSQALADLRGAVRDLRTDPAPAVEHLEQFAESARQAGFAVRSHIEPVAEPAVSATAFRLVREAVTNAMRYSTGRTIDVEVRHCPGAVLVRVADDGTPDRDTGPDCGRTDDTGPDDTGPDCGRTDGSGPDGSRIDGSGLAGLRDEVMALGGRLDAGPAHEGWLVTASLPLREQP